MSSPYDHGSAISRRDFLGRSAATAGVLTLASTQAAYPAPSAEPAPKHTAPLAMWALTDKLESGNVERQLDQFDKAGWGAVLYPRWGLELEYLGEAWFERIRFIVDQAAAREMELWLYDEFCWPSGHAKGLVTKGREDLAAQMMEVEPSGNSQIITVPESADMLRPEATRRFLEVTHERYAAAVGEHFGKTIRAIFTDEPSLAAQHRPQPRGKTVWRFIWSPVLEKALGGDFRGRLTKVDDLASWDGWKDYWAAYTKAFHDNWVAPIAHWCEAHKIAMTGHFLGEGSLGTQVAYNGNLHRQMGSLGIPGIDEISTRNDPKNCEALTLAAIAEYPGRERMVEVFALGPPSMSLERMRQMVEICSVCGIDRYIMAICPHDLSGGMTKRTYLGIHGPQQPWFERYAPLFAQYVAEAAPRARQAQPLGIKWPSEEELWALAGPNPRSSKELQRMTQTLVAQAREAIQARLAPAAPTAPATAKPLPAETEWSFSPVGLNSLRLEGTTLTIQDLPSRAELDVQKQLVRGLTVNGKVVDLESAPTDDQFDTSYRRVDITSLLKQGENRFEVDLAEDKPLKFLPSLILWGNFAVDPQGRLIVPPATIPLGDWRQHGYPEFCGTGCYRAKVQWDRPPRRVWIETGGYPAQVTLNGKVVGTRPWPAFSFNLAEAAKSGANEIEVEITSTVGHLFVAKEAKPIGLMAIKLEA